MIRVRYNHNLRAVQTIYIYILDNIILFPQYDGRTSVDCWQKRVPIITPYIYVASHRVLTPVPLTGELLQSGGWVTDINTPSLHGIKVSPPILAPVLTD